MGRGRFGKYMYPQDVADIMVPLGRATEMGLRLRAGTTPMASDCRTRRCVDPVSLQANFGKDGAKATDKVGKTAELLTEGLSKCVVTQAKLSQTH